MTVMLKRLILIIIAVITFNTGCISEDKKALVESGSPDIVEASAYHREYSKYHGKGLFHVVFLNPGRHDEAFWVNVSQTMLKAADDLEVSLEIVYSERNYLLTLKQATEIASQDSPPDYVILSNEKGSAVEILKMMEAAAIDALVIQSDLSEADKQEIGKPREQYKHWLGSIIPDNRQAGDITARSLIGAVKSLPGSARVLMISGSRGTTASDDREQGCIESFNTQGNVDVVKVLYGEWDETIAYEKTKAYLQTEGPVHGIWAANDAMALGAARAAVELGWHPGEDIVITGVNWNAQGIKAVMDGTLVSTSGGHFIPGGWSMVVLRDLHDGHDFAAVGDPEIFIAGFKVFDRTNADKLLPFIDGKQWLQADYRRYLRGNDARAYDFSIETLVESLMAD